MIRKMKRGKTQQQGSRIPMGLGLKFESEEHLSHKAARSKQCLGRIKPISEDPNRLPWERDYHRILYSSAFKRLKHKTQAFYAPENDHITTRMDHSLQVSSISETICRRLGLNVDLARAIALGHDLGHPPFGHSGEAVLKEICKKNGLGGFSHEVNSLRVIDMMKELHGETLNLTYEVRDGVVCHCGEEYDRIIKPDKTKDITDIRHDVPRDEMPYTFEGCVVRYVDRVAYLAADAQDAISLGVIDEADLPKNVRKILGTDVGEIVGSLTEDILAQSNEQDYIGTSEIIFNCIEELYGFSHDNIYKSTYLERQEPFVEHVVRSLYESFLEVLQHTDSGAKKRARSKYDAATYRVLFRFVDSMEYDSSEKPEMIAIDYLSGMTDDFAMHSFFSLYPMRHR